MPGRVPRTRPTRVLAAAVIAVLLAGTVTAVNRLGNTEPDLAVRTEGAAPPTMPLPVEPETTTSSTSTTTAPPPPSSSSTSSTTVPSPPATTPKPTTVTTRRPRPTVPAVPTSTTMPAPVVSSPCPGAAATVNAYGIYVADRNGVVRRVGDITGADVTVEQMTWSPDGTMVAFSTWQGTLDGTGTITAVSRAGLDTRVVARGPDVGTRFAWSVDSRQIIFGTRDRNTTPNRAALHAADVRSGARRTLVSTTDIIAPIAALPDGGRILYSATGSLAVANLDGSGSRTIANRAPGSGSLSPNGRLYAFAENSQLSVIDVDTGRFVVGSPPPEGAWPGGMVRWSPDGRLVAFPRHDAPPSMSLVVARPDGSVVRTIPNLRGDYRFSPAGDRIAAVTSDFRSNIYDLAGPGTGPGLVDAMFLAWAPHPTLTGIEYFLDHPEHSPDGTGAVCLATPAGPRRLVTFLGRVIGSGLEWSPDGAVLAIKVVR